VIHEEKQMKSDKKGKSIQLLLGRHKVDILSKNYKILASISKDVRGL